jgi:GNAT superfamily N-acetyltransferase
MTLPVELRPATAADAPAVATIWYEGWRDGHLASATPDLVAARRPESFAVRAAERVGDTTVAVVGTEVAGFVMLVDDEVEQVYVARSHRASGVADVLMDAAEGAVAAGGHPAAWLAVVEANTRARRFYERRGWRDDGPFDYSAAGGTDGGAITVRAHRYVKDVPG